MSNAHEREKNVGEKSEFRNLEKQPVRGCTTSSVKCSLTPDAAAGETWEMQIQRNDMREY